MVICSEGKVPAIQEDLKLLDGPVCSQSFLLYGGVVQLCRAKPAAHVLHRRYLRRVVRPSLKEHSTQALV